MCVCILLLCKTHTHYLQCWDLQIQELKTIASIM